MELFGIRFIGETSSDAAMQLAMNLRRWGIDGDRTGPLAISVSLSPRRQIAVSWLARPEVYEAARIVSRSSGIPIARTLLSHGRDHVAVRIPVEDARQSSVWEHVAWGIFLWAASRYPTNPTWSFLARPGRSQMSQPRLDEGPAVASYAAQGLALPRTRSPAPQPLVPQLNPPGAAPGPRRGG